MGIPYYHESYWAKGINMSVCRNMHSGKCSIRLRYHPVVSSNRSEFIELWGCMPRNYVLVKADHYPLLI